MKPIELERNDLNRMIGDFIRAFTEKGAPPRDLENRVRPPSPRRLAGRIGERVHILKLEEICKIGSEDGASFAISKGRKFYLGESLSQLEEVLDPELFVRIHRSYLVNVEHIVVLDRWPGGKFLVTIDDGERQRLTTSRSGAARLRKVLRLTRREDGGEEAKARGSRG